MARNVSLDILKLILSFFVIGLHCEFYDEYSETAGFVLNQGIFRVGVPLFLVINGYFFYSVKTIGQYKNWIKRILKLYGFWMLVYLPIWLSFDTTKSQLLSVFFIFNGYFHLWYIIHMLYASVIFWKLKNFSRNLQLVIIAVLFLVGIAIQYLGNYVLNDESTFWGNLFDFTPIFRNFIFFCLPFFYIGYKINEFKITFNWYHLLLASLLLAAEIALNVIYFQSEGFDILFSLITFCPVLFVCVKEIDIHSSNKNISLVSSSVYLTHPLMMSLLLHFGIKNPTPLTIYTMLLSLALSFFIILLNKKLKFIL